MSSVDGLRDSGSRSEAIQSLRDNLRSECRFRAIKLHLAGGSVTLGGWVRTKHDRNDAERLARHAVPDVDSIIALNTKRYFVELLAIDVACFAIISVLLKLGQLVSGESDPWVEVFHQWCTGIVLAGMVVLAFLEVTRNLEDR